MPKERCNCIPCQNHRIVARNYYNRTNGRRADEKTMPVPGDYVCDCKLCTEKSYAFKKNRDVKAALEEFIPYGPGRYDWDTTTLADYGPATREVAIKRMLNERYGPLGV